MTKLNTMYNKQHSENSKLIMFMYRGLKIEYRIAQQKKYNLQLTSRCVPFQDKQFIVNDFS